jgi:hypothetical protein
VPLGLRGAQAELGTGGDGVAEFLVQLDQAAQQVLELLDGDAAHGLGAGHLRQQEAHLGLVFFRPSASRPSSAASTLRASGVMRYTACCASQASRPCERRRISTVSSFPASGRRGGC